MTFEQLRIFIAVAEREHLTRAAEAIGLTASAVSSAIKNLEAFYNVELFHRVGRNIELTESGRVFLGEAKATLARVRNAELILSEMGGLTRGEITVCASQTIASYWLPPILMQFKKLYPGVTVRLDIGNTKTVTQALLIGGTLFLFYLAYKTFTAPTDLQQRQAKRPLSFWEAAAFQFINPKAWGFGLSYIALITGISSTGQISIPLAIIAVLIPQVSTCISAITWSGLGRVMAQLITKPRLVRAINIVLGLTLFLMIPLMFWSELRAILTL